MDSDEDEATPATTDKTDGDLPSETTLDEKQEEPKIEEEVKVAEDQAQES